MTSKPCVVFDIDGTLADGTHRLHHIQKTPKDWTAYFAACPDDKPIPHMIALLDMIRSQVEVLYASGRSDEVRGQTQDWLVKYVGWVHNRDLFMRKYGDHRPDDVIKIEMLAEIRARGFEPIMAFDDRDRVVAAWRREGVPCMQVAEGDF